jgi:hypothetical protein
MVIGAGYDATILVAYSENPYANNPTLGAISSLMYKSEEARKLLSKGKVGAVSMNTARMMAGGSPMVWLPLKGFESATDNQLRSVGFENGLRERAYFKYFSGFSSREMQHIADLLNQYVYSQVSDVHGPVGAK